MFADNLIGGIRSGGTLAAVVTASQTQLSININTPQGMNNPAIDPNGTVVIGGEGIAYSTFGVTNKVLTLGGLTRGANATDHAKGTVVRWHSDPDEVINVITAHEAGHRLSLAHDTTVRSVMSQVRAFQVQHFGQFGNDAAPMFGGTTRLIRLTGGNGP